MSQLLLFPDPRPLVDRLGRDFFREAPECPGVYLMRDGADQVLYVGKAKNLRKRLGSYRVANPERMPRRHLRMLRSVERIELERCPDEQSALRRESQLLRLLRPRFNRAGTWPGTPRFFLWRATTAGLELAVVKEVDADWYHYGPLGYSAFALRSVVVRLLWCALHPERGLWDMPQGWFEGHYPEVIMLQAQAKHLANYYEAAQVLDRLFAGHAEDFKKWVCRHAEKQAHPFEIGVRESDLETVMELAQKRRGA